VNRLFWLLFPFLLFGSYWDIQFDTELKKDEISAYKIYDKVREKDFFFRWTLYINSGLVVLANYDKFPHQYILYKDYNRNSFLIPLANRRSALMVEFYDFNEENQTAKFRVLFKNSQAEQVEQSK